MTSHKLSRLKIISLASFSGAFLCTLVGLFFDAVTFKNVAVIFMLIFISTQFKQVGRIPRTIAIALLFSGWMLGAAFGNIADVFIRSSHMVLNIVLLFGGMAFIQYPALKSPAMTKVREVVFQQPPGRRYFALSLVSHYIGALISLSVLGLLSSFVEKQKDQLAKRRIGTAMSRGFSTATVWSPFFISMAVVASLLPSVTWIDFALPAFVLGFCMFVIGWLLDRVEGRNIPLDMSNTEHATGSKLFDTLKLIFLMVAIVASIMTLDELTSLSTPGAIAMTLPVISILWQFLIAYPANNIPLQMKSLSKDVAKRCLSLISPMMMFYGAITFGQGLSEALNSESLNISLTDLGIIHWNALAILMFVIVLCGSIMHPIIPVVVIGTLINPVELGFEPAIIAVFLLAARSLASLMSPFSGLTIIMSQIFQVSPWKTSWHYQARFVLLAGSFCVVYLYSYNEWIATS